MHVGSARLKIRKMIYKHQLLLTIPNIIDGRGSSSNSNSSPTTRSMVKRIQEDWDSATDGRETFLYMFKEDHN